MQFQSEQSDPVEFLRFLLERWPNYSSPQLFKEGVRGVRDHLTSDFDDVDFGNGVDGFVNVRSVAKSDAGILIDFEDRKRGINRASIVDEGGRWRLGSVKSQCPGCFGATSAEAAMCTICGGTGWGVV